MERITSEIVGKIFFSENLSSYQINGKPVGTYLADTLENIGKSFISVGYLLFGPKYIEKGLWASHRKVLAEVKLLEDTCKKILDDRKKANVQSKDLAWYLLETQKNANEEDRISDEIIISNYVTFIMVIKSFFLNSYLIKCLGWYSHYRIRSFHDFVCSG